MKNHLFLRTLFCLLLMIVHVATFANWNDPTVVVDSSHVKLGSALSVKYFNAPSGSQLVVYPSNSAIESATIKQTLVDKKGVIDIVIPASAGSHLYSVAIVSESQIVSKPVLVLADNVEDNIKMTTTKEVYSRGSTIVINLEKAPACTGDKVVIYPQSFNFNQSGQQVEPIVSFDVKESNVSLSTNISTAGYYRIFYLMEGKYHESFPFVDIMVGTPASLRLATTKLIPEKDIEIIFSNESGNKKDWIGIFNFTDNANTATPVYKIELDGEEQGSVFIPAGTLEDGVYYKAVSFYNGQRIINSPATSRFKVEVGQGSLTYSDEKQETYYTIVSAVGNYCMTTSAIASNSSTYRNMKLVSYTTPDQYNEWKLVKREDGNVNIVNRKTGLTLITRSALSSNYNLTKASMETESNNGFKIRCLDGNQYSFLGIEEDGVPRYLACGTIGEILNGYSIRANSEYAWKLTETETIVTSLDKVKNPDDRITAEDGIIKVEGNQDYSIWTIDGVNMNKKSRLIPGLYIVKFSDGRSAKVNVK